MSSLITFYIFPLKSDIDTLNLLDDTRLHLHQMLVKALNDLEQQIFQSWIDNSQL